MALDRYVKLTVGSALTGFVVSDLDIDFDIQRSRALSENTAQFTIYNAKKETREKVLKKGASVVFEAGYGDETPAELFAGNIVESNSIKKEVDWITEIKVMSGRGAGASLASIDVSLSYSANTLISRPIQDIANLMLLVVHGIQNVGNVYLPNGWVYAGGINGALRYIRDVLVSWGMNIYIDNTGLVVHGINQSTIYNVVVLAYSGGLLSVEDISKAPNQSKLSRRKILDLKIRKKFTSLLIPQLQVNAPVIFKTAYLNATYIVDKLRFFGNNYGEGDFACEGEVVEQ
jgi:hypothetical protein